MASPLRLLPPRTIVGDRYELRDPIGDGGMGTVYAAVDTKTGQDVAVKVLTLEEGRKKVRDEIKQRFLREVLAISRINHKHVVKVLDWGFIANGDRPYMVMEHLHGEDLSVHLADHPDILRPDYFVDMILELCSAVRAAHQREIIHRDLKPKNVFLSKTETLHGWEVKLLDFGVAKSAGFPELAELTHHGEQLGTPAYMASEQLDGRASKETDQYGIGVLLYYCLTRKLPYRRLPARQLAKAIEAGDFPPPIVHRSDLSPDLSAIVVKAMSKNEKDRFKDVYTLGQRLYEHASPFGKAAWKNLYTHSPVPPKLPAQLTSSIPTALLQRLEGRTLSRDTELNAHSQGPTARSPHGDGLSPSMAELLAPTNDPPPPNEADSIPVVRQRDMNAYLHVGTAQGGREREPSDDSEMSIAFSEGASAALPTAADGPGERSSAEPVESGAVAARGWKAWSTRQRAAVITATATAAVALGVVAGFLHRRPQEHLIRPAHLPPAVEARAVVAPTVPSTAYPTGKPTSPAPDSPKTPTQTAQDAQGSATDEGESSAGDRKAQHRRRRRRAPEETTPDGVLLVR